MEPSPSAGARKPVFPAEVIEALEQGHKIEAIRRMREKTGLGLKESKDAVEAYAHSHDLSGLHGRRCRPAKCGGRPVRVLCGASSWSSAAPFTSSSES
jgi:hypothetical protein